MRYFPIHYLGRVRCALLLIVIVITSGIIEIIVFVTIIIGL